MFGATLWWKPVCPASFRGPIDRSETISGQTRWEKSVRGKGEIVPRTPIRHGFGDPLKPLVGRLAAPDEADLSSLERVAQSAKLPMR